MFQIRVRHAPNIFQTCFKHISDMFQTYVRYVSDMFQTRFAHLSNIFQTCFKHMSNIVSNIFSICFRHISNIFRPNTVPKTSLRPLSLCKPQKPNHTTAQKLSGKWDHQICRNSPHHSKGNPACCVIQRDRCPINHWQRISRLLHLQFQKRLSN